MNQNRQTKLGCSINCFQMVVVEGGGGTSKFQIKQPGGCDFEGLQMKKKQGVKKSIKITLTTGYFVPQFYCNTVILRVVPYTFYYSKTKFRFVF